MLRDHLGAVSSLPASPPLIEKPFPLREGELVALLAFTQALQALAIDAMLPGIGTIARDLHATDPNQRQYIVGFSIRGGEAGREDTAPRWSRSTKCSSVLFCSAT